MPKPKRNLDQQLADLAKRHEREKVRARARAGVDQVKGQLHKRDYKSALETIDEMRRAVVTLIGPNPEEGEGVPEEEEEDDIPY